MAERKQFVNPVGRSPMPAHLRPRLPAPPPPLQKLVEWPLGCQRPASRMVELPPLASRSRVSLLDTYDEEPLPLVPSLRTVPPTRLFVRSGERGSYHRETTLCFNELDAFRMTVDEFKDLIRLRLLLPPTRDMRLFSWGNELQDGAKTLSETRLQRDATLELQLTLRAPDPARGLARVFLQSTALKTRVLPVDHRTTVLALKKRVEASLKLHEHEWVSKHGLATRALGATFLVVASVSADAKTGASALRQGDELTSDERAGGSGGAKKGGAALLRVASGATVLVPDGAATKLELPPEQQRVYFRGAALLDEAATLWELGVRSDDEIQLEFSSPVMPAALQTLRARGRVAAPSGSAAPSGGGGKAKGKGKKKKKKKGK